MHAQPFSIRRLLTVMGILLMQSNLVAQVSRVDPADCVQAFDSDQFVELICGPPVGASTKLISLIRYLEPYQFDQDQIMTITFAAPEADKPIFLAVQERDQRRFYSLQTKMGVTSREGLNEVSGWKVDRVLSRFRISPKNLLALLHYDTDGEEKTSFFLPVSISHSGRQDHPSSSYYAFVKPNADVYSLKLDVYQGVHEALLPDSEEVVFTDSLGSSLANVPILLRIFTENLGDQTGWVTVELTIEYEEIPGSKSKRFFFYHQP